MNNEKKPRKLETVNPVFKYFSLIFFFIAILNIYGAIYDMLYFYEDELYMGEWPTAIITLVVFICVCCLWIPKTIRLKRAIRHGEVYEGVFYDVKEGTKRKFFDYLYMIQFEIEVHGEKRIVEVGPYPEDPIYYIPENSRCKVYVYKGNYYIKPLKLRTDKPHAHRKAVVHDENFVKRVLRGEFTDVDPKEWMKFTLDKISDIKTEEDEKVAMSERTDAALISSRTHLVFRPIFAFKDFPYNKIYIEAEIQSQTAYCGFEFTILPDVINCVRASGATNMEEMKALKPDIKGIVKARIEYDKPEVVVKDVMVEIV